MRKCERKNPEDIKVSEEGGGGAPGSGAEVPLLPMKRTLVELVVPLKPVEIPGGWHMARRRLWRALTGADSGPEL